MECVYLNDMFRHFRVNWSAICVTEWFQVFFGLAVLSAIAMTQFMRKPDMEGPIIAMCSL